jgi:Flp pilus assembly protein TadG
MLCILRQLYRARRGVTALEFAVVAPVLMMLVFGTIEFGRLLWTLQGLQMTAVQAARCMGILASSCTSGGGYSSDNTTSYIESSAAAWGISLTSSNLTLLTRDSGNPGCAPAAGTLTISEVTITYTFQTVVPGLLSMLSSKALQGHACFPNDS